MKIKPVAEALRKNKARDQFPDYEERAQRIGSLLAAPALPLADVALLLDIPQSTLDKLRARGDGPRTFKIGRRLYCSRRNLLSWLDALADGKASAALT